MWTRKTENRTVCLLTEMSFLQWLRNIRFIWRQIVFNPTTYPNFLRFPVDRYLDITLLPTEMSFGVSRDHGVFEWAGNNLLSGGVLST